MIPRTTRLTVAGLIGGIALIASTLLSGSGIYFSLSGSAMSEPARLAVSSVSTLFLTLLAFWFWMQAGRASRERQLRKGQPALPQPRLWMHVAGGMVMSLLSILTATTALVYLGNRDGVQALMNQTAFAATIEPVARLAADMAAIASEASMADRIAAQRSQREAADGGTCGNSPKGTGPLTRMRAAHAAAASDIAARAEKLSREATGINRALITARDQTAVNALFLDAVALGTHADRLAIAMEADALARGYAGQGFWFEDRQRNCRDEELAQLFARIAASASGVAELPTQPPLRREVRIFDAFAVTIPVLLDEDHGRAVGINRATILPFVLFTVLIDLVSLAGAIGHGSSLARRLSDKERAQLHRTAWVLRNFLWEFPVPAAGAPAESTDPEPCQAFIFVPKGGNPERTRQAEYLAALFDLSVAPAFQFEPLIARRKEFEPWVEQMRLASGGATHYAIYPIKDQKIYARIMEMRRDALRALALTPIDGSELPEFQQKSSGHVTSLRAV
jgi:hypothetical protein